MKPKESRMENFKLLVQYDGTAYHGWQRQPASDSHGHELSTIQMHLEKALSYIADTAITVICAGRTDSGVHAIEQVVHFDTVVERPSSAWILGTNSHLPADIRVRWMKDVSADFHARYSAVQRHYQYIIDNRSIPSALILK